MWDQYVTPVFFAPKKSCEVVLPTQPNFVFTGSSVSHSAGNFLDINSPYYDLHSLAWHT